MRNISSVSYERFAEAANTLQAKGITPTVRSIREELGNTGGHKLLNDFKNRWDEEQGRLNKVLDLQLDPSIARAINHFLACKIDEAKTDASLKISDLQKEVDELNGENDLLSAEVNLKSDDISVLTERNDHLEGRIQQLVADAERKASELLLERHASEAARLELTKVETRLENLSRMSDELDEVRKDLMNARVEAAELRGKLSSNMREVTK